MTGLEWFLILALVVVGGMYLFGRRSHATVPSHPGYRDREDEPREQTGAVGPRADEAPNHRESRKHGGCC